MALQSKLFGGDSKLEAAALTDPAHILPGTRGTHVGKIQQALIEIDSAAITPDGVYGKGTAAAVSAFKAKRQILNFAAKIDDIVGKKTIAALDSEMLAKERGAGAGGGGRGRLGFAIVGDATLLPTIVPFNRTVPMILIQTFDNRVPSGEKNDLDASDPPIPPLNFFELIPVSLLDGRTTSDLERLMSLELNVIAGLVGVDMFKRFVNNPRAGAPIEFRSGSFLASVVDGSGIFQLAHTSVRLEFEAALKKQFAAGNVDVSKLEAKTNTRGRFGRPQLTNPDGVKTSLDLAIPRSELVLQAVVGGSFQGGQAALKAFTADAAAATYTATLEYKLLDHFGVDNGDVLPNPPPHGSPGQIAFWILQHRRHPGHNPYVTTVVIERKVSGSLIPDLF